MFGGRWGSRRSRRGSVEDEDGGEGSVAIVKTWGHMYRRRVLFDGPTNREIPTK